MKGRGAFVKFSHVQETNVAGIEASEGRRLGGHTVNPWSNPVRPRPCWSYTAFPLLISKWSSFYTAPGKRRSAGVSQEMLYVLFRRCGKRVDISPQLADPEKILPKFAYLNLLSVGKTITAKELYARFSIVGSG
jgi:hypothetical protein